MDIPAQNVEHTNQQIERERELRKIDGEREGHCSTIDIYLTLLCQFSTVLAPCILDPIIGIDGEYIHVFSVRNKELILGKHYTVSKLTTHHPSGSFRDLG